MQVAWVRVQGAGGHAVVGDVSRPAVSSCRAWEVFTLAVNSLMQAVIPREIGVQCSDHLYISVLGATETTQFPLQSHYSYYKTSPDLSH